MDVSTMTLDEAKENKEPVIVLFSPDFMNMLGTTRRFLLEGAYLPMGGPFLLQKTDVDQKFLQGEMEKLTQFWAQQFILREFTQPPALGPSFQGGRFAGTTN